MSEDESKYEYWLPNASNIKICCEAQVNSVVIIGPNGSGKSGSVEKVGVRALAAPVSDIRNQLIS